MTEPVILTKRGVLHLYPAFESDNLDATKEHVIFTAGAVEARKDPRYRRDCLRCHARLEAR
jgi:hypothetical protein